MVPQWEKLDYVRFPLCSLLPYFKNQQGFLSPTVRVFKSSILWASALPFVFFFLVVPVFIAAQTFSSCGEWRLLSIAMSKLLFEVVCVAERVL